MNPRYASRKTVYTLALAWTAPLRCPSPTQAPQAWVGGESGATDPPTPTSSGTGEGLPTSTDAAVTTEGSTTAELATDTSASSASTGTTGSGPVCGDGVVAGDEACDDGNAIDSDDCTNMCTVAACGDGIQAADEACDDGNLDDADGSLSSCALPTCGDGVVQDGEACDAGKASEACDADCTLPACGDGVLNKPAGEECDAGTPGHACSSSCEPTQIASMGLGGAHTCVALDDGTVRCWGFNKLGALCNGGKTNDLGDDPDELPVADIDTDGEHIVQVASGGYHTCVRSDVGNLQCWGLNSYGPLGYGDTSNRCDTVDEVPPPEVNLGTSALDVAAGGLHTCAIVTGGKVKCWGYWPSGQLGYGHLGAIYAPPKATVPGIEGAIKLELGTQHTCVLQEGGAVRCWGNNSYGQLGLEHKNNFPGVKDGEEALPPINLGGPVRQIAAGGFHNCALMEEDRTVRCWGNGYSGQLGDGISGGSHMVGDAPGDMPPVAVNLGAPVRQIVAGYVHTCALFETGNVKCWGYGMNGSLGYASKKDVDHPGEFPPKDVELGDGFAVGLASTAGYADEQSKGRSTCALLADRSLVCWGANEHGQLGLGHSENVGDDELPNDADKGGPVSF